MRRTTTRRPSTSPLGASLVLVVVIAALAAAAPAHASLPDPGVLWGWSTTTGPSDGDDAFYDVAVSGAAKDTLYAAGCQDRDWGTDTGFLLMARYGTGGGGATWTRAWRPIGYTQAGAMAVTADGAGNVIAAGYAWNGTDYDVAVIKRDASGNVVWTAVLAGSAHGYDSAIDVVTDGAGNVYVSATMNSSRNAAVLKYAAAPDPNSFQTGLLRWKRTTKAAVANGSTEAGGIAYAGGAVYFTGSRAAKNEQDLFLRKYGRDGTTKWLRRWDGAAHRHDYGYAVEVYRRPGPDAVYVAGNTETKTHSWDLALSKYSTGGKRLWTRTYDGPTHSADEVWDLAVDGRGRARVVGSSFVKDTSATKALLVAWNADGNRRWARTYRVSSAGQAAFASVTAGTSAIWVAGHANTASSTDWVVARYTATGTRKWLTRWSGPPADPRGGRAHACTTCGTNGLFVAGHVATATDNDDAAVGWLRR